MTEVVAKKLTAKNAKGAKEGGKLTAESAKSAEDLAKIGFQQNMAHAMRLEIVGCDLNKHKDDYHAKIQFWVDHPVIMPLLKASNLPHFGHKRFSSYEELNAWKKECRAEIAKRELVSCLANDREVQRSVNESGDESEQRA